MTRVYHLSLRLLERIEDLGCLLALGGLDRRK